MAVWAVTLATSVARFAGRCEPRLTWVRVPSGCGTNRTQLPVGGTAGRIVPSVACTGWLTMPVCNGPPPPFGCQTQPSAPSTGEPDARAACAAGESSPPAALSQATRRSGRVSPGARRSAMTSPASALDRRTPPPLSPAEDPIARKVSADGSAGMCLASSASTGSCPVPR